MQTVIEADQTFAEIEPAAAGAVQPRWRLTTRIAFRFSAIYFTFYILSTQMIGGLLQIPKLNVPPLGTIPPLRTLASWAATDLFGFPRPLVVITGSGDTPLDWSLAFCLAIIAVGVTVVWSLIDRRRPNYLTGQKWFRLFLRFGLGSTMLAYGMVKVFPLQMSYPTLRRLLEPYGHFSLMGVLWAQMGSSPPYERFTGCVESSAAILLFVPGLTLLGALVSLAATTEIFVLNMTYDVPVKLFSLHLVVMSLVLLAPDFRRLAGMLVLNRSVGPSPEPPLFRRRVPLGAAIAAQLLLGAWLVYSDYTDSSQDYAARGPAAPKAPLYGIWEIETMRIDDIVRLPLVTDYDRWRRVVVQSGNALTFQRMDDTFLDFGAALDAKTKTIALMRGPSAPSPVPPKPVPAGRVAFDQPTGDRLVLDGEIDGRKVRIEARAVDRASFRLVQSQFRWIQDYPFNR